MLWNEVGGKNAAKNVSLKFRDPPNSKNRIGFQILGVNMTKLTHGYEISDRYIHKLESAQITKIRNRRFHHKPC